MPQQSYIDQAYQFGLEDGQNGTDIRGSAYFLIGSEAWTAYNNGYDVGWQLRISSANVEQDEIEFMDSVLSSLIAGRQPIYRLTDDQMREIESERIGDDFCQYPFLY